MNTATFYQYSSNKMGSMDMAVPTTRLSVHCLFIMSNVFMEDEEFKT